MNVNNDASIFTSMQLSGNDNVPMIFPRDGSFISVILRPYPSAAFRLDAPHVVEAGWGWVDMFLQVSAEPDVLFNAL